MTRDQKQTVDVLNELIETSKDGEAGFRTCAEAVLSPELHRLFQHRAEECAAAAEKLQGLVMELGGTPQEGTSLGGDLHRRWIDLKALVSGQNEKGILNECERGEDVAMERYEKALEHPLPPAIREIVQDQFTGVIRNHGQIRSLRDSGRI
ncbi:hypothetical protein D3C85_1228500 [compost metagenome]